MEYIRKDNCNYCKKRYDCTVIQDFEKDTKSIYDALKTIEIHEDLSVSVECRFFFLDKNVIKMPFKKSE